MHKDLISSALLLGIAGAYYYASTDIPTSALDDEIGPHGLPIALSILLAIVAVAIAARSVVSARAVSKAAAAPEPAKESEAPWPRALGLLAIGILYVPVVDILGYFLTIFLLLAGIALYEGLKPSWRLFAVSLGGAAFFWLLFAYGLGIRQPAGLLF
jgi:putative tricarboxylic transport membrane protein